MRTPGAATLGESYPSPYSCPMRQSLEGRLALIIIALVLLAAGLAVLLLNWMETPVMAFVAAAIIMGTVFAAFILTSDRISKEFGILLAVAILTDALVVRMTLVPAFLTLMGEKAWYIPRWLDRLLPGITIEPPHDGKPVIEPAPELTPETARR